MRYVAAIAVLVVLFVTVFGFAIEMHIYVNQWRGKDVSVALPATTIMAIRFANLIWQYWYVFIVLFVGSVFATIALYRK